MYCSVMLGISLGTRTDSFKDPLIQRTLDIALEFNDLTGMIELLSVCCSV